MPTLCADQWDSEFHLDEYCHEELYFWKNNIEKINSRDCFVSKCHSWKGNRGTSILPALKHQLATMKTEINKLTQIKSNVGF